MSTATPRLGGSVHYVSYGTPNGEFGSVCRAAVVVEVAAPGETLLLDAHPTATFDSATEVVGLCVLNPGGIFFHRAAYDSGAGIEGDPACPQRAMHGDPFRYCSCGWTEPSRRGGTWHRLEECAT